MGKYLIKFGERQGETESEEVVLQEYDTRPDEYTVLNWMYGVEEDDEDDGAYWWDNRLVWVNAIMEVSDSDYAVLKKYL